MCSMVYICKYYSDIHGLLYTYVVHVCTCVKYVCNRGYALLMTANKPETALHKVPTFSLLFASHGGISSCLRV